MEQPQEYNAVSAAAPHEAPYTYTANEGYHLTEPVPRTFINTNRENGQLPVADDTVDDEELDDIFEDGDNFEDEVWDPNSTDLTKSYNRQRQLHDASAGGVPRSNAQKPAANTFASIDDQISALSRHAAKIRLDDVKRGQNRDKDKADRATSELVLDQRTRMILLQMINKGVVSEVHGAISTGKEANVYGAVLYPADGGQPVQRAVKVYKTSILVFKDRERYITGEHRFKSGAEKGNNRKMVKLWAEKEFRNLRRLHDASIPCPVPLQLKLHVLVMSFLGDKRGWAYPRLKDAEITGDDAPQQWNDLYCQLLGAMRRIYQVCGLVHADLSEYNILYNDRKLYIIDVSQSVGHDHPKSFEFLRMDIKNVGDFFRRQGVETPEDVDIFNFIIAPQDPKHPVDEAGMSAVIAQLYETRPPAADTEEAIAQQKVDEEVFRGQHIPRSLFELGDVEGADEFSNRNLIADKAVSKQDQPDVEGGDGESSGDESGSGAALPSDESDDVEKADTGYRRPRGHEKLDEQKRLEMKARTPTYVMSIRCTNLMLGPQESREGSTARETQGEDAQASEEAACSHNS